MQVEILKDGPLISSSVIEITLGFLCEGRKKRFGNSLLSSKKDLCSHSGVLCRDVWCWTLVYGMPGGGAERARPHSPSAGRSPRMSFISPLALRRMEMARQHHWLHGHEFEQTLKTLNDREAWRAAVLRIATGQTRQDLATEQQSPTLPQLFKS